MLTTKRVNTMCQYMKCLTKSEVELCRHIMKFILNAAQKAS